MAIGSAATIEVASAVHPIERSTVHAGEPAAMKSTTTAKASSASPSVGSGEKGGEAHESGEKNDQAKFENGFHDAGLPELMIGLIAAKISVTKKAVE